MGMYQYQQLPEPKGGELGDIRLVTLKQGQHEDDIHVELFPYPLDVIDDTPLTWFALSYRCGSPDDTEPIIAKDATQKGQLFVTRSLAEALRHLRSPHADLYFWIDAICIDQGASEFSLR